MLDVEEARMSNGMDEWDALAPEARVPLILDALQKIEQRLGRRPIVYVRRGFVSAKLPRADPLAAYPLWVAHYTDAAEPAIPSMWVTWTIWQHSQGGQVKGIHGGVDLDRFNGAGADLDALATGHSTGGKT
jgi:GH25 family lysozyme M1 (1,4-beta-N-acetylmuramidase)